MAYESNAYSTSTDYFQLFSCSLFTGDSVIVVLSKPDFFLKGSAPEHVLNVSNRNYVLKYFSLFLLLEKGANDTKGTVKFKERK